MKYLKINTDLADYTSALSDAEIGRLFVALLEYAETGVEQELTGNERFLWAVAKSQIHVHKPLNNGKKGKEQHRQRGKQCSSDVFDRNHTG